MWQNDLNWSIDAIFFTTDKFCSYLCHKVSKCSKRTIFIPFVYFHLTCVRRGGNITFLTDFQGFQSKGSPWVDFLNLVRKVENSYCEFNVQIINDCLKACTQALHWYLTSHKKS